MINEEYADIFKVLSDDNRIKILQIIHKGKEVCVCHLLEQFDIHTANLFLSYENAYGC